MADKAISELVSASFVTADSLFVLQQDNTAKKLTAQILENWLVSIADGHGGIQSISKYSSSGLADTYRITLADTTFFDFVVTNGKSIAKIAKTKTTGLVDTYTITFNDATTSTYTVTNGAKGDKGDQTYVWIKYASQEPISSAVSLSDIPDEWIGIYTGTSATAPTSYNSYKWYQIKGAKGDIGAPATLVSSSITYQVSDSGKIIPSGSWSSSVPTVPQGKYLWTRTTNTFNTGAPVVSYSVSRMGLDGTGSVSSVADISPDENGNVPLTAEHIGAVPSAGGDMTGELKMNGQPISGLNEPTASDQSANKGYVDKRNAMAVHRNILDNSDFRDPVNQRGQSSYVGAVYGIDRWKGYGESCAVNVANGYIEIVPNPENAATTKLWIQQIPVNKNIRGKIVTLAAKIKGGSVRLNFNNTSMSSYVDSDDWSIHVHKAVIPEDADTFFVGLQSRNTTDFQCEWAALYEGEYTVETLPEYQPKGHAAELLECQRYYVSFGNMTFRSSVSEDPIHNITIMFPVPMRIIPTISATAVEGEVPETVSVTRHGIAYSVYGAKYTLRYVSASADL